MSLVEVLVAMTILLVICVSVMGVFVSSMRSTFEGRDFTKVTNHGRTETEQYFGAAFNSDRLRIEAGTESTATAQWVTYAPGAPDPGQWIATGGEPGARWARVSRVRQFGLAGLLDAEPGKVSLDDPLEATTPVGYVHLKEVTVETQGLRASMMLGTPKRLVLHSIRAY